MKQDQHKKPDNSLSQSSAEQTTRKRRKLEEGAGSVPAKEIVEAVPGKVLSEYEKAGEEYRSDGMSQFLQQFLKKMSYSPSIPPFLSRDIVLTKINQICKLLHMNELEVALWSYWADSLNWSIGKCDLNLFLHLTGFQAKEFLTGKEEAAKYKTRLSSEFGDFEHKLDEWESSRKNIVKVSFAELNKKYQQFRKPDFDELSSRALIPNYNVAVESLFDLTHGGQQEERKLPPKIEKKESSKKDSAEGKKTEKCVVPSASHESDCKAPESENPLDMNVSLEKIRSFGLPATSSKQKSNNTEVDGCELKMNVEEMCKLSSIQKNPTFSNQIIREDSFCTPTQNSMMVREPSLFGFSSLPTMNQEASQVSSLPFLSMGRESSQISLANQNELPVMMRDSSTDPLQVQHGPSIATRDDIPKPSSNEEMPEDIANLSFPTNQKSGSMLTTFFNNYPNQERTNNATGHAEDSPKG